MKTLHPRTLLAWLLLSAPAALFGQVSAAAPHLADYVRPFVGTYGEGNTYPGPSAPFGMVQLGPDTEKELWETASGYEYSDTSILGFSCTHLSGTGIPDLGDFLFMPQVGEPQLVPGTKAAPEGGYRSPFSHEREAARAGYYQVWLGKHGINAELTAGERAGMMRFTFPESQQASILTDLSHVLRWKTIWSHVRVEDSSTITGFHLVSGWAKERYLYFAVRYSRPFESCQIVKDGQRVFYNTRRFTSCYEAAAANLQFLAGYKTRKDEAIQLKVAISAISAENALKNLDAELPDWDFEGLQKSTRDKWDRELARIQVEGTQEQKETFYTSLYHAFLTPNLNQDVTGEYRGFDQNSHQAKGFTNYAVFSLWDTYRAEHPLFSLIQAERNADMINALLAHYDQSVDHLLPVWSLQANETWCMIGYHAVPVIVDAYLKGVKGFDPERAYAAIRATALNPHYDSVATYARLGWVPFDQENESVSKTLEYAYDDYCVAQMAKALGKLDDYATFMQRAGSYKNLFDPAHGLMRGKDAKGHWHEPFDPHGFSEPSDFTEGTSWQYSWYVPQDVPGLMALHGGKAKFAAKLDQLFEYQVPVTAKEAEDIQGRIGEYWHGNEPSHHIIYLYNWAGQPWKAQARIHEVLRSQYGNQPKSLSGNDDCGQMSAWYIFSALGFYPVCPGSDSYVIGSPALPKAVLHLSSGKDFTMTAEGLSDKNIYIQSARLNGKVWDSPFLPYAELKDGGSLAFVMGPKPNKAWGSKATPGN